MHSSTNEAKSTVLLACLRKPWAPKTPSIKYENRLHGITLGLRLKFLEGVQNACFLSICFLIWSFLHEDCMIIQQSVKFCEILLYSFPVTLLSVKCCTIANLFKHRWFSPFNLMNAIFTFHHKHQCSCIHRPVIIAHAAKLYIACWSTSLSTHQHQCLPSLHSVSSRHEHQYWLDYSISHID